MFDPTLIGTILGFLLKDLGCSSQCQTPYEGPRSNRRLSTFNEQVENCFLLFLVPADYTEIVYKVSYIHAFCMSNNVVFSMDSNKLADLASLEF